MDTMLHCDGAYFHVAIYPQSQFSARTVSNNFAPLKLKLTL